MCLHGYQVTIVNNDDNVKPLVGDRLATMVRISYRAKHRTQDLLLVFGLTRAMVFRRGKSKINKYYTGIANQFTISFKINK